MKRLLSTTLILFFVLSVYAEENKEPVIYKLHEYSTNEQEDGSFVYKDSAGNEISGFVKLILEDGTYKIGTLINGKFDGLRKWFYDKGEFRSEDYFKNGKRYKTWINKVYYQSGNLWFVIPYIDGKQHGIKKGYYESGALEWETPYKDGKANGIYKEYYESGALKSETPYIDGKQHGIEKEYYESGALKSEIPYKDDKANGIAKQYFESGALKSEIPYKDEEINGIAKQYYESGELAWELPYKDDKRHGITKGYYKSGKLVCICPYTNDKLDGVVKNYYNDGSIKILIYYKNGKAYKGYEWNESGKKSQLTNAHLYNINNNIEGMNLDCCAP